MIAIVDYGAGNLFSLKSSFAAIGAETVVSGDADTIASAEKIVLPGVGAFGDAADKLRERGLDVLLQEEAGRGKPLLGICLGMQLLFSRSYEYGEHAGLSLIPGAVRSIDTLTHGTVKLPHIGWNRLHFPTDKPKSPLFRYIHENIVYHKLRQNARILLQRTREIFGRVFFAEKSGNHINPLHFYLKKVLTSCKVCVIIIKLL